MPQRTSSARYHVLVPLALGLVGAALILALIHWVPEAMQRRVLRTGGGVLSWVLIIRFAPQVAAVMVGCMGFFLAAMGAVTAVDPAASSGAQVGGILLAGLGGFLAFGARAFYLRADGRRWRPLVKAGLGVLGVACLVALAVLVGHPGSKSGFDPRRLGGLPVTTCPRRTI